MRKKQEIRSGLPSLATETLRGDPDRVALHRRVGDQSAVTTTYGGGTRGVLLVLIFVAPFLASIVVVAPSRQDVRHAAAERTAAPLLGVLTADDDCRIMGVLPASPAERAGLAVDDIIARVDGVPVQDPRQLRRLLAGRPPGTEVLVGIVRDARTLDIRVTLGAPRATPDRAPSLSPTHP